MRMRYEPGPGVIDGVGTETGLHGGGPTNTQSVIGVPPVGLTLGSQVGSTVAQTTTFWLSPTHSGPTAPELVALATPPPTTASVATARRARVPITIPPETHWETT